jgi:general secretion pathway protein G
MFYSTPNAAQRVQGKIGARRPKVRRGRGFSFIEIMVVIVIIGLLAGAVTLKVADYMDTAKLNRAKSDLATIVDAVEAFQLKNGRYPTNEEGLTKLPLKNLTDPWGNSYEYNSPAQNEPYEVVCLGADGRRGGEGISADLCSWQLDTTKKVGK